MARWGYLSGPEYDCGAPKQNMKHLLSCPLCPNSLTRRDLMEATDAAFMAIAQFLRRNLVSIAFPTLTIALIWADWSHTRKWKAQQKQLK